MKTLYYRGDGSVRQQRTAVKLPVSQREKRERPENYLADPGLVDAVNVALLLSQPLLLTGEPGTGKTQLADSLAWELGLGERLKFETKSTSASRDLFYTYDALGRFRAAQTGEGEGSPLEYLTYNALGAAIVRSLDEAEVADCLPPRFSHGGKRRSVVLIDEVDKAPRDFPNDLLNEIEGMYFRVPELGNRLIEADRKIPPVVVITSNSEKDLPDAFLRRCIYYNIPFPDRERLSEIVTSRLGRHAGGSSQFLSDALDLFEQLRDPARGLQRRPATAELLDWLVVLRRRFAQAENPLAEPEAALSTLGTLVKTSNDQARAVEVVEAWLARK